MNTIQARSSGGEHHLDAVGVRGSNPRVPTREEDRGYGLRPQPLFCFAAVCSRGREVAGAQARPTKLSLDIKGLVQAGHHYPGIAQLIPEFGGKHRSRVRVAVHHKDLLGPLLKSPHPLQQPRLIGMAAEAV